MFQMRRAPESLHGWTLDEVMGDTPPVEQRKVHSKRKPLNNPRQVTFDDVGWAPVPVEQHQVPAMPAVRGQCEGAGVCLKLSCRYNTTVDITSTGSIHLNGKRQAGQLMTLRLRSGGRVTRLSQAVVEEFEDRVVDHLAGCDSNCALDSVATSPDGMTLEDVGEELGVSREDVRLMEVRALRKLRLACHEAGIEFDDFIEGLRR